MILFVGYSMVFCTVVCSLLSVVCVVIWYSVEFAVLIIMPPKKRSKNDACSSSSRAGYDANLFANARAFQRYQSLSTKVVSQDWGQECNDEHYRHDPQYDEIRRTIITMGWQQFVNVQEETNTSLMLEFLANWLERDEEGRLFVRRKKIHVTADVISMIYGLQDFEES